MLGIAVFSESVTGLTADGFTVTGGTAGLLSGSGSGPYILSVNPAGQGPVICQVSSGAAQDVAGNGTQDPLREVTAA